MEWLKAMVLGVVQGITEFLPISSDGHLLVVQNLFDFLTGTRSTGKQNLFFDVIVHLGTTIAILVFYHRDIATGLRGLRGSNEVPAGYRRPEVIHVVVLAFVATSPLIPLALFFKKWIERAFEGVVWAGWGFLFTAAILLITARLSRREGVKGPAETTWWHALLIGAAQMLAPLPGVSRSGVTIATALWLGLSRTWAVGFSLLIAIPAVLGGVVLEIFQMIKDLPPGAWTIDPVAQAVLATILAGLVGYAAIRGLIWIVQSGRIWYFSVYLIVVGILVLAVVAIRGGAAHGGRATALDRAVRSGAA
jgi:undecaprenyl-diphosphatase